MRNHFFEGEKENILFEKAITIDPIENARLKRIQKCCKDLNILEILVDIIY